MLRLDLVEVLGHVLFPLRLEVDLNGSRIKFAPRRSKVLSLVKDILGNGDRHFHVSK